MSIHYALNTDIAERISLQILVFTNFGLKRLLWLNKPHCDETSNSFVGLINDIRTITDKVTAKQFVLCKGGAEHRQGLAGFHVKLVV